MLLLLLKLRVAHGGGCRTSKPDEKLNYYVVIVCSILSHVNIERRGGGLLETFRSNVYFGAAD